MNTRLQQFLAAENITQAQFADSINVARASVSHILAGRNKPGFDFISSMIHRYPTLNVDWLITGRGKMYKNGSDAPAQQISSAQAPSSESTPEQTPTADKQEPNYDDIDLLFPREETDIVPPQNTHSAEQMPGNGANTSLSIDINTLNKLKESITNQKKATKVIIFYNDGTYQEL